MAATGSSTTHTNGGDEGACEDECDGHGRIREPTAQKTQCSLLSLLSLPSRIPLFHSCLSLTIYSQHKIHTILQISILAGFTFFPFHSVHPLHSPPCSKNGFSHSPYTTKTKNSKTLSTLSYPNTNSYPHLTHNSDVIPTKHPPHV
jgi:hypothetical protein